MLLWKEDRTFWTAIQLLREALWISGKEGAEEAHLFVGRLKVSVLQGAVYQELASLTYHPLRSFPDVLSSGMLPPHPTLTPRSELKFVNGPFS